MTIVNTEDYIAFLTHSAGRHHPELSLPLVLSPVL